MDNANAIATTARIRKHFCRLVAHGYTDQNAFDRATSIYNDISAAMVAYATYRALTGEDVRELAKYGIIAKASY